MRLRFLPTRPETPEEMRRRILEETSAYLTLCLRRPELAVTIPVIPAGSGRFPSSMSVAFWDEILFD